MATPNKTKKEWEEEFKRIYKEFLKGEKHELDIIAENETQLNKFKKEYTLDNNSIEFLPAYFNFIECNLVMEGRIAEVKKYLIVGLTNLMISSKRQEEEETTTFQSKEDKEDLLYKKNLMSRLDLLFARFNITIKKFEEAIDKLSNSIILYSEIYGPESVGLTPHYYYLANYFIEKPFEHGEKHEKRELIIKNIYQKIADIWRKYFIGERNELFDDYVDTNLNYAVGEYYVKKIMNKIKGNFSYDKELDLKFRIIRVLILREFNPENYKEHLKDVIKLRDSMINILDKSFFEDLNEKLNI